MFKSNPIGITISRVIPSKEEAPAAVESTMVSEAKSSELKNSEEPKTAWCGIYLCAGFTFCSAIQFIIFFTTLYPFMKQLDPTVTEAFLGWVISMYALSHTISAPIMGFWSDRIQRIKPPLLVINVIMLQGKLLYFLVELFPAEHSRYVVLVSRLIAGLGWAQVGLLKSFASAASVPKDRTKAIALITGGVAVGITVGPGLQMLFSLIGYPGWPICFRPNLCINISMYTAAPLFSALINVALIFVLIFWFKESYVGVLKPKKLDKKVTKKLPSYDHCAIAVCCAMRFSQLFIFTNLETIGTPFVMMMYTWSDKDAIFYESITHTIRGIFTTAVYLFHFFIDLSKWINYRIASLCSLFMILLFLLLTFSWPFLPDNVDLFNQTAVSNSSSALANNFPGCDMRREWCASTKRVNVWVYYTAMVVLIGVAFPNINVSMNTLFSHIIGPRMQSKQQGIMEMCGGTGRLIGPVLIGYLYKGYGPQCIWYMQFGEIMVMIAIWLLFYRRLVPLRIPDDWNIMKEDQTQQSSRTEDQTQKSSRTEDQTQQSSRTDSDRIWGIILTDSL